ncbi:uncharacterized protein LOC113233348 [Hyposmocoma kahamanoa]|uniref:uncharacterized protein LOC113233348 n=1 Tax=Hyposmocoma kahamanoa TaxID=1477025 RepID=UPI000E6D7637|nr:uncharacterized protein LOC113233348 [Hyposmocoma kahamanoa]
MVELLSSGLDPNYEGGWPIRLAARLGSYSVVKSLIQHGADPHLLSESGASTLQLAVFSNVHWETDRWNFLLSCCDSSQLGDGAAVAIIFSNIPALIKILETGRCNTNIPTTLTGKTVENLAKGYKVHYVLNRPSGQVNSRQETTNPSPRMSRQNRPPSCSSGTIITHHHRNLSPSVARFFHQTAGQSGLTPPRSPIIISSPTIRP